MNSMSVFERFKLSGNRHLRSFGFTVSFLYGKSAQNKMADWLFLHFYNCLCYARIGIALKMYSSIIIIKEKGRLVFYFWAKDVVSFIIFLFRLDLFLPLTITTPGVLHLKLNLFVRARNYLQNMVLKEKSVK